MEKKVTFYKTGAVLVGFPNGVVSCDLCPLLETYARKQCRGTGEYILDSRATGYYCPIQFEKEEA